VTHIVASKEKHAMQRLSRLILLTLATWAVAFTAHAAEIGHFNDGLLDIQDYFVPASGLYGALYNYFYTTDRLNDRNGDEIRSVTINPRGGPGVTLGVDVNLNTGQPSSCSPCRWSARRLDGWRRTDIVDLSMLHLTMQGHAAWAAFTSLAVGARPWAACGPPGHGCREGTGGAASVSRHNQAPPPLR
jgi:hypothetical protein